MKVVSFLKEKTGYSVSPDALFDIQVIWLPLDSLLSRSVTKVWEYGIVQRQMKVGKVHKMMENWGMFSVRHPQKKLSQILDEVVVVDH